MSLLQRVINLPNTILFEGVIFKKVFEISDNGQSIPLAYLIDSCLDKNSIHYEYVDKYNCWYNHLSVSDDVINAMNLEQMGLDFELERSAYTNILWDSGDGGILNEEELNVALDRLDTFLQRHNLI